MRKRKTKKVYVIAATMTSSRPDKDYDYRSYSAKVFFEALDKVNLKPEDIDMINFAYNERAIPDTAVGPMMSEFLTGCKVPVIGISQACAGGGVASYNMYNLLQSGRFEIGAVVACSKSDVFYSMETASGNGNYNDLDFNLGLTHMMYSSLKEDAYKQRYTPDSLEPAIAWAKQDYWFGQRNNMSLNYKKEMPSDEDMHDTGYVGYRARSASGKSQATCLIFVTEDIAEKFDEKYLFDIGMGMKPPYFGQHYYYPTDTHKDADITYQPGVEVACKEAYENAEISVEDVDVFQVHDLTPYDGFMIMESLGVCERGKMHELTLKGETSVTGKYPVNTDGGAIAFGHSSVGGDFSSKIVENIAQIKGECGERQVEDCKVALAHAYGTHQSVDVVAIIRRENNE